MIAFLILNRLVRTSRMIFFLFFKNPGDAYDQSGRQGYMYGPGHDHVHHLQGRTEHRWDTHQGQNHQHESGEYVYSSTGTAESNGTNDYSAQDYEQYAYSQTGHHSGVDGQDYGEHASVRNHFQVTVKSMFLCFCHY